MSITSRKCQFHPDSLTFGENADDPKFYFYVYYAHLLSPLAPLQLSQPENCQKLTSQSEILLFTSSDTVFYLCKYAEKSLFQLVRFIMPYTECHPTFNGKKVALIQQF